MYLRHSTRRKDGKTHVYWQLVRSVRRGAKIVQETVAQLGELDEQGRARAKELARSICRQASGSFQGELFEPAKPGEALAVKLDGIGWNARAVSVRCGWAGNYRMRSSSMSC